MFFPPFRPSPAWPRAIAIYTCIRSFLLTRPSRDVTQYSLLYQSQWAISTHTSLAGRDRLAALYFLPHPHFYSHVPRGTWQKMEDIIRRESDFYSHVPRGTWQYMARYLRAHWSISTHTSLAGRDANTAIKPTTKTYFYSHVPRGTWLFRPAVSPP